MAFFDLKNVLRKRLDSHNGKLKSIVEVEPT